MRSLIWVFIFALCLVVYLPDITMAETIIVLPADRNATDNRSNYSTQLLRKALDVTIKTHGSYDIQWANTDRVQERVLKEMAAGKGEINLAFSGASAIRDKMLLPIRVPLAKGMLGYRIFIIRADKKEVFENARTIDDLAKLSACQGVGWPDSDILKEGGLQVHESTTYEGLFKMVSSGRCDFFPRAVHEPYLELLARKDKFPDLIIENTWLIHYPFATYFYVKKQDVELAERLTIGLNLLLDNGMFEEHMQEHPATKSVFGMLNAMKERKLLELKNPFLHSDTPLDDERLWWKVDG
ncbi:MAG: hypothetical protein V7776_12460 [Halopseudomonas aestusnigri]